MNWALVTGAGKRLGRGVALELARAGHGVVVHYRNSAAEAEEVAAEARRLGAGAAAVAADLGEEGALAPLIEAAQRAAGGKLTALVNSASAFDHDTIANLTGASFDRHMRLNTLAPVLLSRAFAGALAQGQRGVIVNFLDFKLASPYPDHFAYTLSKYALAGATELLARALAPHVRVNAVAPGYVLPSVEGDDAVFDREHAHTPLHYGPTAEDIAGAVRFLVESPAVTGQTIYVDAGRRFISVDRDMSFS